MQETAAHGPGREATVPVRQRDVRGQQLLGLGHCCGSRGTSGLPTEVVDDSGDRMAAVPALVRDVALEQDGGEVLPIEGASEAPQSL